MSSVGFLTPTSSLDQPGLAQAGSSAPGASSGSDPFSSLLAQTLALQIPPQAADPSPATAALGKSGAAAGAQASSSADMTALGQALSAGNISSAQQAYQSMQTKSTRPGAPGPADDSLSSLAQAGATRQAASNILSGTGSAAPTNLDTRLLGLVSGIM